MFVVLLCFSVVMAGTASGARVRVSLGAAVDGLSADISGDINIPLDTRNDVAGAAARSGGGGTANSAQQYHKRMP